MTAPGTLTDETEVDTLAHDVQCVLLSYTRDRPDGGLLGRRLTDREALELAKEIAPALGVRIGGRYVRKRDDSAIRKRNAQVVEMFNGRNRAEVMRHFAISRRLLYSILAEAKKRKVVQRF